MDFSSKNIFGRVFTISTKGAYLWVGEERLLEDL